MAEELHPFKAADVLRIVYNIKPIERDEVICSILIATNSLRGSVSAFDAAKFIRAIIKATGKLALAKEVINLLRSIPTDTVYDRDYCDLVFKRTGA